MRRFSAQVPARLSPTILFFVLVLLFHLPQISVADTTLGIGSKAPSLDIEHYLSDGGGYFGEVTDFEEGNVYMVEFWATWCGPCVASMPHLAELQNQYRGEGFQIVSVSDEDLETVEQLLEQPYPDEEVTFGELTSAYTLTVDPDGSVSRDYMEAAGQNGLPTSFIVGKSGLVEWIGHPMSVDEPLAAILNDSWDREAYKEQLEFQQMLQTTMQKVQRLAGTGKFEDAIKVIDKISTEIRDNTDPEIVELLKRLNVLKYNLRLDSGDQSPEVLTFFREQLKTAAGQPREIIQFAYGMMASMQQGTDLGALAGETISALGAEVNNAEADMKPLIYVLAAQLSAGTEKFDQAIRLQQQAIDASEGRQRERMEQVLDQLTLMAEKAIE
ncbi:MAG: TlpA disulfide reductase family protein, partial [Planctomycetota bacterium]